MVEEGENDAKLMQIIDRLRVPYNRTIDDVEK